MTDRRPSAGFMSTITQLRRRLKERLPGRIQVLTGPRQVGKTTLLLALAKELPIAIYHALDDPASGTPGWWDAAWREAKASSSRRTAVMLLDEIHYLPDWERRVKTAFDEVHREGLRVRFVLTGSSSLLLGRGLRETLAGRFEWVHLLHWGAQDFVSAFGLDPEEAAWQVALKGGFPGAFALQSEPARWQTYLKDAIIEPAVGRDLLLLNPVRRPELLRQLFFACCGHPAQIVSLQKLSGRLGEGALETVAHYLRLLQDAYLVAALSKFSPGVLRRRASPPKLVVLNNAFLAAMESAAPDPAKQGGWIENACLARAVNRGYQVSYWREEPLEVDGVLSGPAGRFALEVKTGPFTTRDLAGLLEFCRRNPGFKPLALYDKDCGHPKIPGIHFATWQDFLLDHWG